MRGIFTMIMALGLTTGPVGAAPLPTGFVYLRDVAPEIAQDMRYAGPYNFTDRPVPGYEAAECVLARQAAEALASVQAGLTAQGYGLVVWDCYRPDRAVKHFAAWARNKRAGLFKPVFYPDIAKADLHRLGYIAHRSAHSRGSTVDLGLVRTGETPVTPSMDDLRACDAPRDSRPRETTVDMGTNFDCFSDQSGLDARLPMDVWDNRDLLSTAMSEAGFRGYSKEWWHFRLRDEVFPGRQFDFVIGPRTAPQQED